MVLQELCHSSNLPVKRLSFAVPKAPSRCSTNASYAAERRPCAIGLVGDLSTDVPPYLFGTEVNLGPGFMNFIHSSMTYVRWIHAPSATILGVRQEKPQRRKRR